MARTSRTARARASVSPWRPRGAGLGRGVGFFEATRSSEPQIRVGRATASLMLEFLQRPAPLLAVLTVTFGCSGTEADDAPGKGGTSNGGSGGASGQAAHAGTGSNMAGATASGGTSDRGGTGGAGGANAGTGTAAGASGRGGAGAGGSAAGKGGAAAGGQSGTGAAGAPGGASGSGGHAAGGQAGAESSGGKGGASGGMSGGGNGGSAGADVSVVGAWDGALLQFPCGSTHDAYNCSNTACTNNQTTKKTEWTIGGTADATYEVTFNVRGVVETYYYPGATRDGGSIKDNPDLFASGGAPQDSSGSNYDYNTYQLVVTPPVTGEPNTYFLNSVTMAENPHASNSPTTHVTFPINYTKTIKVTGGGKVTFTTFDSNCTFLQNCGPTQGSTCANPRTVSLDGVTPAAPTSFMQPFEAPSGAFGQWVFFDITKVVEAP